MRPVPCCAHRRESFTTGGDRKLCCMASTTIRALEQGRRAHLAVAEPERARVAARAAVLLRQVRQRARRGLRLGRDHLVADQEVCARQPFGVSDPALVAAALPGARCGERGKRARAAPEWSPRALHRPGKPPPGVRPGESAAVRRAARRSGGARRGRGGRAPCSERSSPLARAACSRASDAT